MNIDNATLTKARMLYARVLVDMPLANGFPEELFFSNENDELVSQKVHYDWLPTWCTKCEQFGHQKEACKMGLVKPQLQVDEDGFRPLQKAFKSRSRNQILPRATQASASVVVSTVAAGDPVVSTVKPHAQELHIDQRVHNRDQQLPSVQQAGIIPAPSQQPQEDEGAGQSRPGGALASVWVRSSPPLPLSNGFTMLNEDLINSYNVDVNAIALGAHPICDDD